MKYTHTRFAASLALGTLAVAGFSTAFAQSSGRPIVITPPAVNDGSNWSRAPFPAARQFDDVKAPDGQPIDKTGANSDVANIEPPPPPARVAILQPAPQPAATPVFATDPGLLPTGRVTVATASMIDAAVYAPTIRSTPISSRDAVISDIETRLKTTETAMGSVRSSAAQMSTDGRRTFKVADDEVKQKERALKSSLRAARKASQAEWDNAREKLAADYEAYGAALAQVDAAAGVR